MRLLIYFYIVLGLFKLFKGLTHDIHSNSAYRPGRGKPKSNELPSGSCTTGKGWAAPGCVGGDCSNIADQMPIVYFILF